jgi:hypothetical protein
VSVFNTHGYLVPESVPGSLLVCGGDRKSLSVLTVATSSIVCVLIVSFALSGQCQYTVLTVATSSIVCVLIVSFALSGQLPMDNMSRETKLVNVLNTHGMPESVSLAS